MTIKSKIQTTEVLIETNEKYLQDLKSISNPTDWVKARIQEVEEHIEKLNSEKQKLINQYEFAIKQDFFKRFDNPKVCMSDIFTFLSEMPEDYSKEKIIEGFISILLKEVECPEDIIYNPHNVRVNQDVREQYQLNTLTQWKEQYSY